MAIYQLGLNVNTRALTSPTIELRDEAGSLFDTISRGGLVTWEWTVANPIGVGNSATGDELIGSAGADLFFWDWETIASHSTPGVPAARYFLPASSQVTAIDIFRLNAGNDILNLSYNRDVVGFQSYDFQVTAYGGDGDDILLSGGGNDQLFGESGLDTVFGAGGDDFIDLGSAFAEAFAEHGFGGSGNDTIYGGLGNDTLSGGTEDDRLFGTLGLDTIGGDAGNDTIYGGDGENPATGDALEGGAGDDTIYGGAGADNIAGAAGFLDRLFGDDGNDGISDSDGFVLMVGGAGNDSLYSNFANNWVATGNLATVYGGGGADNFSMGSLQENLNLVMAMDDGSADAVDSVIFSNVANEYNTVTATLGGGNDLFFGSLAGIGNRIDRVAGDAGNDTIYGGAGSDTLDGGAGNLDILIGGAQTALAADAGDVLVDSDGVAYARGGEGDDSFTITFGASWVGAGGNASDLVTLDGNGGADSFTLFSGNAAQRLVINTDDGAADGNDFVTWAGAASSYDTVTAFMLGGDDNYVGTGPGGGTGNRIDIVYGGLGNDTLSGGAGDDSLFGSNASNTPTDGNDTLFGRAGNDTLVGGYGIDTLDGGADNDVLVFNADNTVTGDNAAQDYVQGWDGSVQLAQYSYSGLTVNWTFDTFEGNTGVDSLVGTSGNDVLLGNTDDLYINGAGQTSNPGRLAGMEVVLLGAGADFLIASDPNGNSASGSIFTTSISIFAGDGGDVVYTGDGADLLVGDDTTAGNDVLAAGVGNDTVWGDLQNLADSTTGGQDTLYGAGGNDTLYGGAAADTIFGGNGTDTINSGTGDDFVLDINNVGLLYGGDGSDTFVLGFQNSGQVMSASRTGLDAVGDGDDKVFVVQFGGILAYGSISLGMGAGNDVFISGNTTSGNGFDRIAGESGNDLISTWSGNDTVDGGAGGDVIWGGAGVDTIMGGADSDYLYGGFGDGDLLIGGDGGDFYYWARNDGDDRIEDQDPGGVAQDNYILVFAGFETNPANDLNGDAFIDGAGVVEVDGNLYDNDGNDMVQITVDPNDSARLVLTVLQGEGAGSTLNFDPDEITMIGLANSDVGNVTAYQWNGSQYVLI